MRRHSSAFSPLMTEGSACACQTSTASYPAARISRQMASHSLAPVFAMVAWCWSIQFDSENRYPVTRPTRLAVLKAIPAKGTGLSEERQGFLLLRAPERRVHDPLAGPADPRVERTEH